VDKQIAVYRMVTSIVFCLPPGMDLWSAEGWQLAAEQVHRQIADNPAPTLGAHLIEILDDGAMPSSVYADNEHIMAVLQPHLEETGDER
jgi:hypothetical protein